MTSLAASISELKQNPIKVLEEAEGHPVRILNRDQTVFYCVPPELYERLAELAEDHESSVIADARLSDGQKTVPVALRDL